MDNDYGRKKKNALKDTINEITITIFDYSYEIEHFGNLSANQASEKQSQNQKKGDDGLSSSPFDLF